LSSLDVLLVSAVTLGLVHTIVGPDHYLPFIVLGRAEGWPLRKTLMWTFICGLGHVLSSVVVGALGVALGWAVSGMEQFEGIRGNLAGWALVGFGLLYFVWGAWRGWRGDHVHVHHHSDGTVHWHRHDHPEAVDPTTPLTSFTPSKETSPLGPRHELAVHEEPAHVRAHRRTVWTLFIIFVLGPCEPLIPLLIVPAARHSWWGLALVATVFGVATIGMMMTIVTLGHLGLKSLRVAFLERYVHAVAGATLLLAGLAMQLLGL